MKLEHVMGEIEFFRGEARALRDLAGEQTQASTGTSLYFQKEVDELKDRVAQAALTAVIEPKVNGVSAKLERLTLACMSTDLLLEYTSGEGRALYTEFGDHREKSSEVFATKEETEVRCYDLACQMGSLGKLLGEVQDSLGDISSAVVSLSSKAERTEMNVLREELCTMSESVKDREQAVLFGARCLSCNRVFDDVTRDTDVVDLSGEKHKNALFSQVQNALHSPKIDPLAKIKVLAVKVGRPMTVPASVGGGRYSGRDGNGFACGLDDTQLVQVAAREPAPQGDLSIVPRVEGVPRNRVLRPQSQGRCLKAPPVALFNQDAPDGPMDFKHPLSQLLDRCNFRSSVSNF